MKRYNAYAEVRGILAHWTDRRGLELVLCTLRDYTTARAYGARVAGNDEMAATMIDIAGKLDECAGLAPVDRWDAS